MTTDEELADASPEEIHVRSPHRRDQPQATPKEKLACENCRQRKPCKWVKCERVYPCTHCIKTNVQCHFPTRQKPSARRQRILMSNMYEKKIDRIEERIEELSHIIRRGPLVAAPHQIFSNTSPVSNELTPLSSTTITTEASVGLGSPCGSSDAEIEGEVSLLAHAVFATEFLQDVVGNCASTEVASEMTSVLAALITVVNLQKQHKDRLEDLYPHALSLQPGASLRQLPMPPTDQVLACLRLAQDNTWIQVMWLMEFQSISQFTAYFIKVSAPGPVTEADLIIVYAGLYWLFCECINVVEDESLKQSYNAQAIVCRAGLETVLSRLPFHLPASIDYVYALAMASLHCLQKSKPGPAWNFISRASYMSQSLGFHTSLRLNSETTESKNQKTRLFWAIYTLEKMLSLRIGRSSSIRESDITVQLKGCELSSASFLNDMHPIWVAQSALQGRIYEEIYSPTSLADAESARTARAKALAADAKSLIEAEDRLQVRHMQSGFPVLGATLHELFWRADRATNLSLLTLIYRSIPPDGPNSSIFCTDCISTARDAIKEHEYCVTVAAREPTSSHVEMINWTCLSFPFTPFVVLFCYMIETSDPSDLQLLKSLTEALQLASKSVYYQACQKQLALFKALYDVANKYFEVNATMVNSADSKSSASALDGSSRATRTEAPSVPLHDLSSKDIERQANADAVGDSGQVQDSLLQESLGFQLNSPGAELATWFYTDHQMMKMLEDV